MSGPSSDAGPGVRDVPPGAARTGSGAASGTSGEAGRLPLRWLASLLPESRWLAVASIALAALASGASVALMGVSAWLLSRAAEHPPVLYLEVAAVGVRFFGISRGVLRYTERLVGHDLALRVQSALRLETYQRLADTTLLGTRRGDLLTRVIADVEAVQDLIIRVLIPFASAALVMTATSAMLAVFSPGSAAVLLASALLAGLVVPWLAQRDIQLVVKTEAETVAAYIGSSGRLDAPELAEPERDPFPIWIRLIQNDRLLSVLDKNVSMVNAFRVCDDLLRQGVQGITDLITLPGLINLDFADVRTVIRGAGSALLGIGYASGPQRAEEAALAAISSPLLETPIDGARGILLGITGGSDLSLSEISRAAKVVSDAADPEANIIFGATVDPELEGKVWVTVVAAGFTGRRAAPSRSAAAAARACAAPMR